MLRFAVALPSAGGDVGIVGGPDTDRSFSLSLVLVTEVDNLLMGAASTSLRDSDCLLFTLLVSESPRSGKFFSWLVKGEEWDAGESLDA